MNLSKLTALISLWHENRKITINGNSTTQSVKLGEEFGELCAGIVRQDKDKIKDSLGDMYVVMVAIAELEDLELRDCIESAYDEIKGRKGHLNVLGNFVKEEDNA